MYSIPFHSLTLFYSMIFDIVVESYLIFGDIHSILLYSILIYCCIHSIQWRKYSLLLFILYSDIRYNLLMFDIPSFILRPRDICRFDDCRERLVSLRRPSSGDTDAAIPDVQCCPSFHYIPWLCYSGGGLTILTTIHSSIDHSDDGGEFDCSTILDCSFWLEGIRLFDVCYILFIRFLFPFYFIHSIIPFVRLFIRLSFIHSLRYRLFHSFYWWGGWRYFYIPCSTMLFLMIQVIHSLNVMLTMLSSVHCLTSMEEATGWYSLPVVWEKEKGGEAAYRLVYIEEERWPSSFYSFIRMIVQYDEANGEEGNVWHFWYFWCSASIRKALFINDVHCSFIASVHSWPIHCSLMLFDDDYDDIYYFER